MDVAPIYFNTKHVHVGEWRDDGAGMAEIWAMLALVSEKMAIFAVGN